MGVLADYTLSAKQLYGAAAALRALERSRERKYDDELEVVQLIFRELQNFEGRD